MKVVFAWVGGIILVVGAIVALFSLDWGGQEYDLQKTKHFAPKYEQVRRNTFEHSRAFNQGMIQELQNMQFQYEREKDPQAKAALASIIVHRASGYNMDDPDVPSDLRDFINKLKKEQGDGV